MKSPTVMGNEVKDLKMFFIVFNDDGPLLLGEEISLPGKFFSYIVTSLEELPSTYDKNPMYRITIEPTIKKFDDQEDF